MELMLDTLGKKVMIIGPASMDLLARLQDEGFDVEVCTEEEANSRTQHPEVIRIFHDDAIIAHSAREGCQQELTPKRSRGKGKKVKPWDNEWNTTSKYLKSRGKPR
jgi:hypothetical protein